MLFKIAVPENNFMEHSIPFRRIMLPMFQSDRPLSGSCNKDDTY